MSFGNPNNHPCGQQPPQAQYGAPQQPPQFSYPPQAAPGPGYPQQPGMPVSSGIYASWGARFGATLIDFLIAVLVPIAMVAISMLLRHTWGSDCEYLDIGCTNAAKREILPFIITLWVLAFLWFVAANIVILVKEGKGRVARQEDHEDPAHPRGDRPAARPRYGAAPADLPRTGQRGMQHRLPVAGVGREGRRPSRTRSCARWSSAPS